MVEGRDSYVPGNKVLAGASRPRSSFSVLVLLLMFHACDRKMRFDSTAFLSFRLQKGANASLRECDKFVGVVRREVELGKN